MTDTRAAFEAWYGKFPRDLKRHESGRYCGPGTENMWEGWQAAINHERSECAKVCEARAIDPYAEVDLESRACAAAIRARSQP